jgi:hypothetical protein
MDTRSVLEQLLATLAEEEARVLELVQLASRERDALVNSDYATLNAVTETMLQAAGRLDSCEERREALLAALGKEGAGLNEIVALAELHGMDGFSRKGEQLRESTAQLQELQEQNARLILSAAQLRERWLNMLTRLTSPAYGSGNEASGHRFLSRSA